MMRKFTAVIIALLMACLNLSPVSSARAEALNLVPNPSFESANVEGTAPVGWSQGKWGTNTTAFSYPSGQARTGTKSSMVNMTKRTSGDAKWYFTHTAVKPNQKYLFSEYYKSNVATEIDIEYKDATGKTSYVVLSSPAASPTAWKQVTASFTTPSTAKSMTIFHVLNKVGSLQTDDFMVSEDMPPVVPPVIPPVVPPVVPPVPTAPTVSVSSPLASALLSGTQTIMATASDAVGLAGVQFLINDVNIGAEDTSAPYSTSLNTVAYANGQYTIKAIARNTSALTASSSVVVSIQNTIVTPPQPPTPPVNPANLIPNPSAEDGATTPTNWLASSWGTNTSSLSYVAGGHSGAKALRTEVSAYTSGAANWHYTTVPVTPNTTYKYENWYQSDVATEIDAEVTLNDGSVQYFYVGAAPAGLSWTKFSGSFTTPANSKSVVVYQILAKKGYLVTDDYSLTQYTPVQFQRGLVSLTFDDGWRSIYSAGLPLLKKYGLVSTQYLNSEPVIGGYPDYMTPQMIKEYYVGGHELAWHTRSHSDITQLGALALSTELSIPDSFLQSIGLSSSAFTNFASPFGAYNSPSITSVKSKYRSHRSTDVGYNSKDSLTLDNIKVQNITSTTTPADVQGWVNKAVAEKTWLVIVFHEVDASAEDAQYSVTPANLDAELRIVKQSGVTVKTVEQALNEVLSQL